MEKSRIKSLLCTKEIDYGKSKLPISWKWNGESCDCFSTEEERYEFIRQNLKTVRDVVCLITEKLDDPKIIGALHKLSQEGKRIYIVVGCYTDKLDQLRGHCLIRESEVHRGSLLLIDPKSNAVNAILLSDSLTSMEYPQLADKEFLSDEKSDEKSMELFRYFCYMFWEKSTYEYLDDISGKKEIKTKGVDVYFDYKDNYDYLFDYILDKVEDSERKDLLGCYISLASEKRPCHIKVESKGEISIGNVNTSTDSLVTFEQFRSYEPKYFEDDIRYLSIKYIWNNSPFVLPKTAQEASLYKQWGEYRNKVNNFINQNVTEIRKESNKINDVRSDEERRLHIAKNTVFGDIRKRMEEMPVERLGEDIETYKIINDLNSLYNDFISNKKERDNEIKRFSLQKKLTQLEEKLNSLNKAPEQSKNERYKVEKEIGDVKKEIDNINKYQTDERSSLDNLNSRKEPHGAKIVESKLELLPSVGKLYEADNKFYLAISYWEDYEVAKREALRFNAKLCSYLEE